MVGLGGDIIGVMCLLYRYHILLNIPVTGNFRLSWVQAMVPESLCWWVAVVDIGMKLKQQGGGVGFTAIRLAESRVFGLSVGCLRSRAVGGGSAGSWVSRAWQ